MTLAFRVPVHRATICTAFAAALICSLASRAGAQLAPLAGAHYAARPSDTGFSGAVTSRGSYSTSIPLELPPVRGGLPVPLQVAYGGHQVGAAGLGWDIPQSYIFRSGSIAHRRPAPGLFSVTSPPAMVPPSHYVLVLAGAHIELVRNAADTAWVGLRGDTQIEVRAAGDNLIMYDGEGVTYYFSPQGKTAGSRLVGGDLYLLVAIVAHGNTVRFTYAIEEPLLPNGNKALSINILNVVYNQSPTNNQCFKNIVHLFYDVAPTPPAGSPAFPPLAMTTLNGTVLARVNKLASMSVRGSSNCSSGEVILRDYTFHYQTDLDTGLPQLQSVTMTGRGATPERNITLPVATYSYGSVVDPVGHGINYALSPSAGPPFIIGAHHYEFGITYTRTQDSPESHSPGDSIQDLLTTQNFLDVNGDGRPDFLSEVGFYPNLPGADGTSIFGDRQGVPTNFQQKTRSAVPGANLTPLRANPTVFDDTLRQVIDMNGDGRMDVVETVLPDQDHWIIHLNTPDPADPTKTVFVDITVPVTRMRAALDTTGPSFGRVSMARNTTIREGFLHCWHWQVIGAGFHWVETAQSFCPELPVDVDKRSRTITEFELRDVNGDGYPDFVYNASAVNTVDLPADFQPPPPPHPTQTNPPQLTSLVVTPDMAGSRDVKVLINIAGAHLASGVELFASPITLEAGGAAGCGIGRWEADAGSASGGILNQTCGLEDVNGDGLLDRVTSAVENGQMITRAALGTGMPDHPFSSDAIITLPGPLGRTETKLVKLDSDGRYHPRDCTIGAPTFDLRRTRGLRDINGDGIPDYIAGQLQEREPGIWSVAMGTGTGFTPPVPVGTPVGMELSWERSACGTLGDTGELSATPTGLYDIDGDGQPEIVTVDPATNSRWDVYQLVPPVDQFDVGPVSSVPASGRLTRIDNGHGAVTRIGYKSAKEDTQGLHAVPFPEIVVTTVATTDTSTPGTPLASATHYAYRGASLIFDPAQDGFVFPGYQRVIEMRASSEDVSDGAIATVTDHYGPTPFDPTDITARFQRYLQTGRVKDVTTLAGRLGLDPWTAAIGDMATSPFRKAGTHYDWQARVLAAATPRPAGNERCIDITSPYDYAVTPVELGAPAEDECTKRGFIFATAATAWRGDPGTGDAFTVSSTVKTRTEVKAVDDLERITQVALLNDTSRSDDDLCIRTVFATPTGSNERVLSAPASRTVIADACGDASLPPRVSETFEYDTANGVKLPAGQVAAGLLTSDVVSRRNAETGAPINDATGNSDIRMFDATYEPVTHALTTVTQVRDDGASQRVAIGYDPFAVAIIRQTFEATDAAGGHPPVLQSLIARDPVTLDVIAVTDPNGMVVGTTYDGFGRVVASTVTPPSGSAGVLSATSYLGFALGDTSGRRVVTKVFTDPVAAGSVGTAAGRTSTTFLDALGRQTRSEVALGVDVPDILVVGRRSYDLLGRVKFEADPHPSTESAATAYGTSYFFNLDGTPSCTVRARGPHASTTASDESTETYATCTSRFYTGNQEVIDVADAASLLPGSPQTNVFRETTYSAIGQMLDLATFQSDIIQGSIKQEESQFGYDALGQLNRSIRKDLGTASVTASLHHDNMGRVLSLEEPDVATVSRSYDRWGALTSIQWCDPTISSCAAGAANRRTEMRYDERGRLVHSEDRTNDVVMPQTVRDFVYDVGVNNTTPPVTAGNVLGRLAKATAATSSVAFSYDALGRVNANVFTDRTVSSNNVYVQKFDYHGDGTLQTLHLLLPDNAFGDEKVDYVYDSGNRPRSITYNRSGTAQSLFAASTSSMYDAFGRLRSAKYGATTYAATYADTGRRLMTGATISAPGVPSHGISYLPVAGTSGAVSAFDPVGRERIRTETLAGVVQPTTVNDYDHIGRLAGTSTLSSGSLGGQRLFAYDPLGNLTLQQDMATSGHPPVAQLGYQTVDRDRLCTIAYGTASPPTACNVSYDGIGNIVSQPDRSNDVRTFSYFPGGQIATITRGTTTATFDYDAFGAVQRLVIDAPSASDDRNDKHFGGLLYQRDELVGGVKKTVLTRSIPGPGGLVATRHGPGASDPWTFSFGEARGTRFVVDQTGAQTQQVTYTPFGEASSTGAPAGSQLHQSAQWNGGDALSALGLVQVGARIYDPVIGRFLSRDPLLLAGAAATSNPYAFASNDPINHSDPSGMEENPWDPLPGCVICDDPYQPPHQKPEQPADPPRGGHPGHHEDKPKEPATSTATSSNTLSRRANPFASVASLWQTAVESTRPDPWDSPTIIHTGSARDPLGRFDPTRRPVVIRGGSLYYVKKDQETFSPEFLTMIGMGLGLVGGPMLVDVLFTPVGAGVGGSAVAAEAARGGQDVEQGIAALESAAPALDNAATAASDRLVLVTSWASRGVTPDLAPGRYVQLGPPTWWNFLKTGLPGGKAYFGDTFPWVTWAPSDVDITNFISGLVPRSALSWPQGIDFWKGILGQRIVR